MQPSEKIIAEYLALLSAPGGGLGEKRIRPSAREVAWSAGAIRSSVTPRWNDSDADTIGQLSERPSAPAGKLRLEKDRNTGWT